MFITKQPAEAGKKEGESATSLSGRRSFDAE
jgi:hypothetical protein